MNIEPPASSPLKFTGADNIKELAEVHFDMRTHVTGQKHDRQYCSTNTFAFMF